MTTKQTPGPEHAALVLALQDGAPMGKGRGNIGDSIKGTLGGIGMIGGGPIGPKNHHTTIFILIEITRATV